MYTYYEALGWLARLTGGQGARKKRILNPPRDLLAEVIGGQFCSREIVMNQNLYFSYILMVEAGVVEPPS